LNNGFNPHPIKEQKKHYQQPYNKHIVGFIHYASDDLFHLYKYGVLKLHVHLLHKQPSTAKKDALRCEIASKAVEVLRQFKLDASWDGLEESPITIQDVIWYQENRSRHYSYDTQPNQLLTDVVSQLESVAFGEKFPFLRREQGLSELLVSSLEDALLLARKEVEKSLPKKKRTKRQVAKDLINNVFTKLRRKGFIAISVQVPRTPLSSPYWVAEQEALLIQMDKKDNELHAGRRKSLPTKYVTYNRSDVLADTLYFRPGFITHNSEYDYYDFSAEKVGTEKLPDVGNIILQVFKEEGFDVAIDRYGTVEISDFNKLVNQAMD